jgi:CheY-like chemotaxis protein
VDDLPDVRLTICGILEDAGYFTRSVATRAEALQLLEDERFHVAVLDIRLDDTDEDNLEGLVLMEEIAENYPTTIPIMLTGYADVNMVQMALRPKDGGLPPAYTFLKKTELESLPSWVQKAFDDRIKIDKNLIIIDEDSCITILASRLRFKTRRKPESFELEEEIREIFQQLFSDCEKITVSNMQQGFSGSAVFRITPRYMNKGKGESLVAKVGGRDEIEIEKEKHEKLVHGIVGGNRYPMVVRVAKTKSLGGILYPFAGLGWSEDFAEFYRHSSVEQIESVVENLYKHTCFPSRNESGILQRDSDLGEFYLSLLHLNSAKLLDAMRRLVGKKHVIQICTNGDFLFSQDRLVDPVLFSLSPNRRADGFFSMIHGDLSGYNILIDRHQETWLIDFATVTERGHILQDFASLENFVKMLLIRTTDHNLLFEWEKKLIGNFNISINESRSTNIIEPDMYKANVIVRSIRNSAKQTLFFSENSYLLSLLYNSLRSITFYELSIDIRSHAFLAASIITEKLQKEFGYV